MSIKQFIGEKASNSFLSERDPLFGGLVALVAGVVALIPGGIISESLPMDDSLKEGNVVAVEQYQDVISYLSENDPRNQIGGVPSGLTEVMNEAGQIADEKGGADVALSEWIAKGQKVGTSMIVDTRLNEVQKKDLVTVFEESLGSFNEVTGLGTPDYADIDEAIAATPNYTDEYQKAEAVVKSSKDDILQPGVFLGSGAGAAGFIVSLFLLVGLNSRRLRAWEMEKPVKPTKKLKYKH